MAVSAFDLLKIGIGHETKYKETSRGGLAVNVIEC